MAVMPKSLQIKMLKELCESYGVPTDLIDWEAEVDETLSFEENRAKILPLIKSLAQEPEMVTEYDELKADIERLRRENEKLRKKLEEATLPEKRKYERMIREYKKRIEQLEKQKEELEREIRRMRELMPEELERKRREELSEIERRLEEFREALPEYSIAELLASLKARKPPEITNEEWERRMELIRKELERRGVPKSPVTGEFMQPVTEWHGVKVPPEMRFWYSPTEERYYRDGKPVTPEAITRALRQVLKPVAPAAPERVAPEVKPRPPPEIPPYHPLEAPPSGTEINRAVRDVLALMLDEARRMGKSIEELTDEEVAQILARLRASWPRQVAYFLSFMRLRADWKERWHEFL